jgi:hypothetical protein
MGFKNQDLGRIASPVPVLTLFILRTLVYMPDFWVSPLCLLTCHKLVQDLHSLFQCLQPNPLCVVKLSCVCASCDHLDVEVFSIRCCAHGRTEERFHHEAVMRRQGRFVGLSKRYCQLLGSTGLKVSTQRLGCEIESTGQPQETFSCGVFLRGKLGLDQGLQGRALEW